MSIINTRQSGSIKSISASGILSSKNRSPVVSAGSAYLDGVLDSTVVDLDATIEASYPGSGTTWANLVESPADGSAQTAYDAENTGGFTFTGTAGDSGAYWLSSGNNTQGLSIASGTGVLFDIAHRTDGSGSAAWIAMTFQSPTLTGNQAFFGNTNATADGIRMLQNSGTGNLRFFQDGDTGNFNQAIAGSGTWAINTPTIVIVTFDSANPGSEKYWVNSTTGSNWAVVFSPNACVNNSSNNFVIGNSINTFPLAANAEIYSFAAGNEVLDDAKAALIIAHLEARHGRDYTP